MQYSKVGEGTNGASKEQSQQSQSRGGYSDNDDSASMTSVPFSITGNSSRNALKNNAQLNEPLNGGSNSNSNKGEDDPFYVFREDLYRKLDLVDEALTEYLRIVHQTDTAVNTHAVKDAKKALKRHMRNAESTKMDVQMTISLVETQNLQHITPSELYERKAFLTTSTDRLNRAKTDMNVPAIKQKLLADERAKAVRRQQQAKAAAAVDDDDDDDLENNNAFLADNQAQTSLLMQQQDETLDELGDAVTRVGMMAENISEEIGLQNKMLNEMEDDLADAEEKLGLVMGKLAKFLKTKNKWQLGTIMILCLIVLILIFLVFAT